MRKRALLAIAFASGLISSQMPVVAEDKTGNISVVRLLAVCGGNAEMRAYYLLQLASSCLDGNSYSDIENQYISISKKMSFRWYDRHMDRSLARMAEIHSALLQKNGSAKLGDRETTLANLAVKEALTQIDKTTTISLRPQMTFLALCLYKRLGNTDGAKECDKLLAPTLKINDLNSTITSEQASAAIAILNAKAYGYMPLEIKEQFQFGQQEKLSGYSDSDFKASEKLRLEALALADKLPENDNVRRRAHRDMVIWYRSIGKEELAKAELQTLYRLVKYEDERVLYPQQEGCGQLVWWRQEQKAAEYGCGMG